MPLQKTPISINFTQGLDTKTDPYQVQVDKFLTLTNSVFTTTGRLTKRNGYIQATSLPHPIIETAAQYSSFTNFPAPVNKNTLAQITGEGFLYKADGSKWIIQPTQTNLTTLNDNLIATGSNLYAYSKDTKQWLDQGLIQPVHLETQSMVRNSSSQTSPDAAISSSGLTCMAYMDGGNCYYHVIDSTTGQQIVPRTQLTNATNAPRVFLLEHYFIITFISTITATYHLQYLAIPIISPNVPGTIMDISTTLPSATAGYDGYSINGNLYLAWSETATIQISYLTPSLIVATPSTLAGHTATFVSMTADSSQTSPVLWVSWWESGSTNGYAYAFNLTMAQILAPTQIITGEILASITSTASQQLLSVFYEINNDYAAPYPVTVRTDFVKTVTVTQAGVVSASSVILRSVGLASKAFISIGGKIYMMVAYGEANQPTYFLIDSTGAIYMRLAYSNGGGYVTDQTLPNVSLLGNEYLVPYLIKDFLTTVNKTTNIASGTPVNAIYSQTGVNLARFTINDSKQYSSEIANTLHLTGGQLWMYDSVKPVEHGFHVWPEDVQATTSTSGGSIGAGTYNYVFTYEWTDNKGNLHRSAPSIPLVITTTGATSSDTLYVPTLRLTFKLPPNPVRIVGYRWSVAQQTFYQFTSVTNPHLNNTTVDFITITDTLADSSILGNAILYTTGGVVENIAAPASIASALFKNRLFIVDAEDRNLLWYSKQVIEAVPVEMSDLFTLYVAPTSGAQGSTGPITALSAMDDKLIIFKKDAIYYLTGTGPDNTGANNDFSDPVFITSSVGCANPSSIVLVPSGIMFQSDKGIWLLGRDLSTVYIGAPVESYNSNTVVSALNIPATTQARFILDNNVILMYDYFYNQWGTFTNKNAISATIYQGLHTYLNQFGFVFQEIPGRYLDGSDPVLMSFTTSWIHLEGIQGFQRLYFMYLLGTYYTPFTLNVGIAYNYNPSALQQVNVMPDNFTPDWGGGGTDLPNPGNLFWGQDAFYGDGAFWGSGSVASGNNPPWGSISNWGGGQGTGSSADSSANILEARIFPEQQKCQSFQITVSEIYDSTMGVSPGAGLSLSGLNLIVGAKKGYRTQRASQSFG